MNDNSNIRNFRKEGRLEDAYNLALMNLEEKNGAPYAANEMAWVLYDMLLKAIEMKDCDSICSLCNKLQEIGLVKFHQVNEFFAWKILKFGFSLLADKEHNSIELNTIVQPLKILDYPKPSEVHSAILNFFVIWNNENADWYEILSWWKWQNLREKDYLPCQVNGKTYNSLAEKVISKYSNWFLKNRTCSNDNELAELNEFLHFIEEAGRLHPEYEYIPLYIAKLKLLRHDKDPLLPGFIDFARRKRNEFWVWSLMARFPDFNDEEKLACYCRAMICKVKDEFLVKVRTDMIPLLLKSGYPDIAAYCHRRTIKIFECNGWEKSAAIAQYESEEWFLANDKDVDETAFYLEKASAANALLTGGIPEVAGIITSFDKLNNNVHYLVSKEIYGYCRWNNADEVPQPGDTVRIRLTETESNSKNKIEVISMERSNEKVSTGILRDIEGNVSIRAGSDFGFVSGCYLQEEMLSKHGLKDGDFIKAKAVISYNKRKERWGWRIVKVVEKS